MRRSLPLTPLSRWPRGGPSAFARGVTLIEMMIVIAIVGIIAAIAVPNLNPLLQRQHLTAAAEDVAGFLDRARKKAYVEGRCYRVRLQGDALVMQKKVGPDGANCVGSSPGNSLVGATWATPLQTLRPPAGVSLSLSATGGASEIIFRPNGRLRGNGNWDVTDDLAQVGVSHAALDASIAVRVQPHGRICKHRAASATPVALSTALECPREGA